MTIALMWAMNANALIVSITGQGDIPAQGMELTLTEAEEDPLSGEKRMEINGTLLSSGALNVTIVRTAAGLNDEFCCAGQCMPGNKEQREELQFMPQGIANWFVHYTPAPGSDETVVYTFSDGTETRTLTVHYNYAAQAIETTTAPAAQGNEKILRNGQVLIRRGNDLINLQGQTMNNF